MSCLDELEVSSSNEDHLTVTTSWPVTVELNGEISTQAPREDEMVGQFPLYLRLGATITFVIIFIIGTVGNILVPVVVCRTKELRNSTNLFLINLSVADLLILLICVPTALIELHSQAEVWHLGPIMCKLVPLTEWIVAHGSILTMLAISTERYYAICKPLFASYKCTRLRALIIIGLIWLLSFLSTGPILSFTEYSSTCYIDGSRVNVCITRPETLWGVIYFFGIYILFFWVPLFVLIVIYVLITKRLVLDSKIDPDLIQHSEVSNTAAQSRARRQVVYMLAAVVSCFFLCLMPYRLFSTWLLLVSQDEVLSLGMDTYYSILYGCRVMLYLNSAVNPILYNVISSKFRHAFVTVLWCGPVNSRRALLRQSTFNTTSSSTATMSLKSDTMKGSRQLAINLGPSRRQEFELRAISPANVHILPLKSSSQTNLKDHERNKMEVSRKISFQTSITVTTTRSPVTLPHVENGTSDQEVDNEGSEMTNERENYLHEILPKLKSSLSLSSSSQANENSSPDLKRMKRGANGKEESRPVCSENKDAT